MSLEIFERAAQAYENTTEFLEKAVFPFRKAFEEKHGNNEYSIEKGLNSFDVLIQYSLFELALADGNLDPNEVAYMKDTCKYMPFPDFFRYYGINDITWDKLVGLGETDLAEILDKVLSDVVDITKDFINSFALYDFMNEEKDYTRVLANSINAICCGLLAADGEVKDEEQKRKCLALDALEAIQTIIVDNNDRGREREEADDFDDIKLPDTTELEKQVKKIKLQDFYEEGLTSCGGSLEPISYSSKELATVYIDANDGTGTGFIISSTGLCFTCCHVVEGTKEVFVRIELKDGTRIVKKADVIVTDKDDDYALLQIKEVENLPFFDLEDNYSDVKMGDNIAIFGFPFGQDLNPNPMELEPTLTKGYVATKNKAAGKVVYYLDARSCPGNSGGPVFALKSGKVIGYLCGSYGSDRANLVYCRSLTQFYKEQSFKK